MATERGQLEAYGRMLDLAMEGGRRSLRVAYLTGRSYGSAASVYDNLTWMGADKRHLKGILSSEPPTGVVCFPSGICIDTAPPAPPSLIGRLISVIRR